MRLFLLIGALAAGGCAVFERPVELPEEGAPAALVGSAALGAPMDDLARHPWIALRDEDGSWERWEVMCCPHGGELDTVRRSRGIAPLSDYGGGGGKVKIHGVWRGDRALEIAECVRREAPKYPYRHDYMGWPGPNSNTFVDYMARACDLGTDLLSTSIGKDYRGLIGISLTAGGTGFQIETPIVGLKLGLTEGIEVHLLGLAVGIDWWPPAIIVPVGDGRIGFADR